MDQDLVTTLVRQSRRGKVDQDLVTALVRQSMRGKVDQDLFTAHSNTDRDVAAMLACRRNLFILIIARRDMISDSYKHVCISRVIRWGMTPNKQQQTLSPHTTRGIGVCPPREKNCMT